MKRIPVISLALGALITLSVLPFRASASEEGRRNTAYALGAATVYFIVKKRPVEALISGAATAYSVKRLQDSINARHRRERQQAARRGTTYVRSTSSSRATTSASVAKHYYDKGVSQGYKKGYEAGYAAGVKQARASSVQTSGSSNMNDTYQRVLLARK
ncbi:MAG TPA: hypothetical protein VNK96_07250 [Fimbriimonadales bacterium]|nr:hypothetical protein [Fimbriimonadales bacterium]